jgi:lipoprotein-anchoring transpeptidase ErfK/SrfK
MTFVHLRRTLLALILTAVLWAPGAAHAADPAPPDTTTNAPRPDEQPQEAAWARVVVDLSEQRARVFDTSGTLLRAWKISTGGPATPTPTGNYRVTSKSRRTFATGNPRITMEHMVRFRGGIGFHSIPRNNGTPLDTPLGERGVSHGCVRLADRNARELYRNLPVGAEVVVRP